MDLNLDALNAFIAFSEVRNFTRAAEALHISQPALHVKIKKLSASLGVPLYLMNGKEVVLTNYGRDLARFGREAQGYFNDFLAELIDGKTTQPVILAAGGGAYMNLLGDAIRRFKGKGKTSLQLLTADRPGTLELLRSGQAHLGVTVLEHIPEDLEAHLLAEVPGSLVVLKTHPLGRRRSVSIRELDQAELILPSREKPHRNTIERTFEAHGLSCRVALETSGWDLMIHFVKLGMGEAIVNGCCSIPKTLRAIPIKGFPMTKYYLLKRRNMKLNQNQQLLSELIREHVSY